MWSSTLLDDAGFADLQRDAANELFRVVCARHRQRATIVVTNLPFKQWGECLPSPAQAVAIADRLVDDATILRFTGQPYRRPRDVHGAPLDGEYPRADGSASGGRGPTAPDWDHRPGTCPFSAPGSRPRTSDGSGTSIGLRPTEVDAAFPHRP